MWHEDWFILMVMGGVFLFLGLVFNLWGRNEEKRYYNSVSTRLDVREYLEHWPWRPGPAALKMGGWVAIAVGVVMLALGGVFLRWI